ncbi:MAG TPA: glycoside hydrolase family 15 protein [Candidatus Binatus sp.]|uniref:glycoside hydrolase family 15 protein n=1 Tax=Candidatus Binatus sp. TaxID=2811406 RepID=UPI002F3ECD1D
MSSPIENYALIGNLRTAALVNRTGSIDWMCIPRFDSGACFASLLGTEENGRWLVAPQGGVKQVRRKYRDDTLVLETEFETESGVATVVDFMPVAERPGQVDLIRIVKGIRGQVPMRTELTIRFDYGHTIPWVRKRDYGISAISGPNAIAFRTAVPLDSKDFTTIGEFTISEGQSESFRLTGYPSHEDEPGDGDPLSKLSATEQRWRDWAGRCSCQGEWRDAVMRSLITLKALTYTPTGGIIAAPTTSLPECLGGPRNWDYRFCWLRDSTFTLYALLISGYTDEARAWREWLLRAIAGHPQDTQIMYGVAGERMLTELELPWLSCYEKSAPVRIGNAAHEQFQLDVYGEVIDTLHVARKYKLERNDDAWRLQSELMDFLESGWKQPDEGIWEVRGPRRDFTHSKVMAWVAVDRSVKEIRHGFGDGPLDRWLALRDEIHRDVCERGFDVERNAFVQYYGSKSLDASLLMIPLVGFLPAKDPRVVSTVAAIERELIYKGLVLRYPTETGVDGLPPGEGAFLPCTFWLADNYALAGRIQEARDLFLRLLDLRNDVGLLSEEYDPALRRQLGNFPQAFTHVSLVNTAHNLMPAKGPAEHRSEH